MSIELMTRAWKLPLPHADKIVLLALCDNANDQGLCWPSVRTLKDKCGMDERTIQRVITRLSDVGHVTINVRPGRSNYYTVHPTPGAAPPRIFKEPSEEPSGNRAARKRAADTATRLPEEFELTQQRRQIAETEHLDAVREFANFCDHFRSASGQRARKHDWDAAWRVWCRRAPDLQLPRSRRSGDLDEHAKLRRLMDNRGKCVWLTGFRDPLPGESAEQYLQAQNAEHRRWEHEQGRDAPRFSDLVTTLADSKRVLS